MKLRLFGLCTILMVSCSLNNLVADTYVKSDSIAVDSLVIYKNHFYWSRKMDLSRHVSDGYVVKLSDTTFEFTSRIVDEEKIPLSVVEAKNDTLSGVIFVIKDMNDKYIPLASIATPDGQQYSSFSAKSILLSDKVKFNQFSVLFSPFKSVLYDIKDPDSNVFVIKLHIPSIPGHYVFFDKVIASKKGRNILLMNQQYIQVERK